MNPAIRAGNGIYFLVFMILILASIIFILHLMGLQKPGSSMPEKATVEEPGTEPKEQAPQYFATPFEVDIDLIAGTIIPQLTRKESTGDYAERILHNLARHFKIVQGILYLKNKRTQTFEPLSTYAYASSEPPASFKAGDGLPGQVAKDKSILKLENVPEGYLQVESGLGHTSRASLLVIPLLLNKETIGIIELASFKPFDEETEWTFRNLAKIIGNALVNKMKSKEKK